jgi:hypothetical protein
MLAPLIAIVIVAAVFHFRQRIDWLIGFIFAIAFGLIVTIFISADDVDDYDPY